MSDAVERGTTDLGSWRPETKTMKKRKMERMMRRHTQLAEQ